MGKFKAQIIEHIDETKEDIVKWYNINYLRQEADAVFADRLMTVKAEQAKSNKQYSLFD